MSKLKAKYIGAWTETPLRQIPLPYNASSLEEILEWGANPEQSEYTHQEIAQWCDRMFMAFLDTDADAQLEKAIKIAADVDCQWDLFLANTFTLAELQNLDFSTIRLPLDWFLDWKLQLKSQNGPTSQST